MASPGLRLQRNELIDLPVTGLAFGGMGIAKLDEFVVFVKGAVPGDVVRARVTKNKKRYAEARVDELLTPSPDRCAARCHSFGQCGGCVWQDLDYAAQLKYKASQVAESLEHLGGIHDFELMPIVGMDDPWRYRNRADFSIGQGEAGAVVGFRPPGRWDSVLQLSECHLLGSSIERVRATVETWLREQNVPGWSPRTAEGYARHLLVRSAQGGGEVLVSLVTIPGELPDAEGFVRRLREVHPEVVGIFHSVNAGTAEISAGLDSTLLWGRPYLLEKLGDITLKVSIDAFFQTNTVMANQLYAVAAREVTDVLGAGAAREVTDALGGGAAREATVAADGGRPLVWDLFSGVGSIGLYLARDCRAVLGIEAVPAAVEDAGENARLNDITNATFIEGDVAKVLREVAEGQRKLPEDLDRPDVIIVDPPRAGLSKKAVSRIAEVGAPRIIYVSCNPSTMAPNVAQMQEFGYRFERVTPVDMFPHTPHVECVGVLTLQR